MIQTILLTWLTTIIISYCMKFILIMRLFKDVGDEECILNMDAPKQSFPSSQDTEQKMKYIDLIPVINVLSAMKMGAEYLNNRETILRQLDMMGYLKKMSEWERLEYKKKPTGFNTLIMPIKTKFQIDKSIKLPTKQAEGNLWYIIDEKTDEFIIVNSDGIISNYSEKDQKRIIKEKTDKIKNEGLLGFLKVVLGSEEEAKQIEDKILKQIEELEEKQVLQNSETSLNEISKQKTDLKKLRDELTIEEVNEETKGRQKKNERK